MIAAIPHSIAEMGYPLKIQTMPPPMAKHTPKIPSSCFLFSKTD